MGEATPEHPSLARGAVPSHPLPDARCSARVHLFSAPVLCTSASRHRFSAPRFSTSAPLHLLCSTSRTSYVHAIICRPWMFCSARDATGAPVAKGVRMTSFVAIKDDLLNAGAEWVDEPVVNCRNMITSRTPDDLTPFCLAIIDAVMSRVTMD